MRTLHTMWEKLTLLYHTLTNIFKLARTTIHPLKGLPTVRHRKIIKYFVWWNLKQRWYRKWSVHILEVNMDFKWLLHQLQFLLSNLLSHTVSLSYYQETFFIHPHCETWLSWTKTAIMAKFFPSLFSTCCCKEKVQVRRSTESL